MSAFGTELKDAISEKGINLKELPGSYQPYFEIDDVKISKAKYLKHTFEW